MKLIFLCILLLPLFVACGSTSNGSGETPAQAKTDDLDPLSEDALYGCNYQRESGMAQRCFESLDMTLRLKLIHTLNAYDQNPNWPPALLVTTSFKKRYPLSSEQTSCLMHTVCRKE